MTARQLAHHLLALDDVEVPVVIEVEVDSGATRWNQEVEIKGVIDLEKRVVLTPTESKP